MKRIEPNNYQYVLNCAIIAGVSEAINLNDPDGNGLELYWDRPRDQWPVGADRKLTLYAHPLDMPGLLALAA